MTGWLGVDVGWVFPAADSDGNVYEWTRYRHPREPLAAAGPVKITTPDGRVVVKDAYSDEEAAILDARRSSTVVRGLAKRIVTLAKSTDRGLALEDWSTFSSRKRAWTRVYAQIAEDALRRNVPVVQVNRAYTSLTCPKCDHKGRENRPTRDTFLCARCGFAGHADVVAAMNIARRAAGTFTMDQGRCKNTVHDAPAWKAGVCIFCYRFRRRRGHLPTEEDFALKQQLPEIDAYRERMRQDALAESRERRDAATDARKRASWIAHDEWGAPRPYIDDREDAS